MKHKLVYLIFLPLALIPLKGACSFIQEINVGASGGFNHHVYFTGDIYAGFLFDISKGMELRLGYITNRDETDFDGVKELKYKSGGAFLDCNYFLTKKVYAGVRIGVNLCTVEPASKEKYETASVKDPPTEFTGLRGLVQLGIKQPIAGGLSLRLQAQLGIHNYKMATGALYFDNTKQTYASENYAQESHVSFNANITLGLTYSLKDDK